MSLFTSNLRRSMAAGFVAVIAAHMIMWIIPHNLHAYTLTQTSVAFLAIASLMIFVVAHHHRSGTVLTRDQEELVLVCAFGLAWLALLVGGRAVRQRSQYGVYGELNSTPPKNVPVPRRRESGFAEGRRAWPCARDDAYCVVEEWSYY
ncbi:hypothetical protein BV25DRAFT_1817780 [Artomyces pyxidatus]|uniref:Uncharacterized protein n=1 Tax=Artomyces pyxidatus TaxID=48021 RepID=A0ACB8TK94_9AGAM|nr:hypothetical protein BV25DRAFT_1817780 [Artomyces pyxidatus]